MKKFLLLALLVISMYCLCEEPGASFYVVSKVDFFCAADICSSYVQYNESGISDCIPDEECVYVKTIISTIPFKDENEEDKKSK